MFGFHASTALWIALGVLLVATVFVRNLYCRYLCPVGAALGVLSNLTRLLGSSVGRSARPAKSARRHANGARFRDRRFSSPSACDVTDCERLYMDQQKCPHWIIIRRKSDFAVQR